MDSPSGSGPSWGLVLVRIACGWILLKAGWYKISSHVDEQFVVHTREAFAHAPGIVRAWGENVVLVHPWFFAQLIMWGELLGGLCLFLGVLTRPVGLLAAFMMLNFVFAGPPEQVQFQMLLAVGCLGCSLSAAGRKCGADVFLDGKLPAYLTWSRG